MLVLSHFSYVQLFAAPWTVAPHSPLSMGFSRQENWSGLPCPLQGIFPTQGSNLCLLHLLHWQAGSLPLVSPGRGLRKKKKVYTHTHTHTRIYKTNKFAIYLNWHNNVSQLCMSAKSFQSYPALCDPMDWQPTRLLCPWDAPGKNTGVGCCALLQGTLPTQGWNLQFWHFLNWQAHSLPPVPPGKPKSIILQFFENHRQHELTKVLLLYLR